MKFKPMLISNDEYDLDKLDYSNMYISIKRDGIRAEIDNTGIKNRSLKTIRNKKIQEYFKKLYESLPDDVIIEGEIYSPTTPLRTMSGICNSLDYEVPQDTKIYIFDIYDPDATFEIRMSMLKKLEELIPITLVEEIRVYSKEEVLEYYDEVIEKGYEGCVLKNGNKKYKQGRTTINQGIIYKLKPIRTDDLKIIGINERMKNLNKSEVNELGHKYKRNTVADKAPTSIAATFNCLMDNGEETKVTITGTEAERKEIWKNKANYIGKYVVVKSMDYGAKNKLRHPRMIGIKDQIEK